MVVSELGCDLVRDGFGCYAEPGSVCQVDTRVIETEEIVTLAPVSGGDVSDFSDLVSIHRRPY